ncbi:STAS domain-containing protein [Kovacikia minuta CCNUW1]|uniref:STAS domain-containing protein n=1 Tax=Kovacikia minuta TaxID=2931930 RepID=UPI001CD01E66|nr:STAS domain-containing protein [Kovacikia minuta]UBF26680.1 STAS domain-containing protein [Kovacikia minuta CCNUW1]
MNTTLDFSTSPITKPPYTSVSHLATSPQTDRLPIIVLQPNGSLDSTSSSEFQSVLEESLEQVTEGVIVDLLWVESTDADGIAALVAGIQRATLLGKLLSFQAMDGQTRAALEVEWNRQREISFGPRNDLFEKDLERFLDQLTKR